MTLEYRMGQYMDLQTHRCRFCGELFMPIKVHNGCAAVIGFILSVVAFFFCLSLVGVFIGIPLVIIAFGLYCIKKTVWKCHQCERVFVQ